MAKRRMRFTADGVAERGSVLGSLYWVIGFLSTALTTQAIFGHRGWLVAVLASLLVGVVLFFLYWFTHFAKTDPHALRSERYNLLRMGIERGLIGDDRTQLVEESADESDAPGPGQSTDLPRLIESKKGRDDG